MLDIERTVIEQIAADHGGLVTTAEVLEIAKDPDSPLHKHFTWDDTEAAHQWRHLQARQLIARCKITVVEQATSVVRAFVSLPADRQQPGGGYRLMSAVLDDDAMRAALLADMEKRLAHWAEQSRLLSPKQRRAISGLRRTLPENPPQPMAASA